jgi:hypothetical protein
LEVTAVAVSIVRLACLDVVLDPPPFIAFAAPSRLEASSMVLFFLAVFVVLTVIRYRLERQQRRLARNRHSW